MNKSNVIIVFATAFLFFIYISYANGEISTAIDKQIKYLEDQNNTAFERLQQQVYDCTFQPLSTLSNATLNDNNCTHINLQEFQLTPLEEMVANNSTYQKNLIAKQLHQAKH